MYIDMYIDGWMEGIKSDSKREREKGKKKRGQDPLPVLKIEIHKACYQVSVLRTYCTDIKEIWDADAGL